jgi:ribosome biogenesis GTPase A
MHKANQEMTEALGQVDLVIELLDCRLPWSSQNPSIARLAEGKPCIKVFSKADLADPAITALWQDYFEQTASVKTLLTTLDQPDKAQQLLRLCRKLVPAKPRAGSNLLAMITGIPNVGKSTLINAAAGRKVAKTGDEPAITKGLQKIKLSEGITLLDTPGILWPKIHNENSGYRLAVSGAIKSTATDTEDLAFYLAEFLLRQYPDLLQERYALDAVPASELEFLQLMGARRGCLRGGGHLDLEKACTILVNEFRAGTLGRITLETPAMILAEEKIVAQKKAEKAQRDAQRKRHKQGSR